ncbi:hypothetical protein BJ684DRAFT_16953 [Piptocephalis cylindrospora]|uniref:Uncharacterized protein n=1 Tax=Piptocephalis cylindrospora TaxID=1907219 RepID=A0A4P9Y385_9FUNG|nr:hypothetical protein BJ684DRAFT_16953 [Piptocephalis cylindrospora]|eukprot:RKP12571.1 hypothetical protein BJ684DRAFT_16953 [Piptocephalis cylindrospora]
MLLPSSIVPGSLILTMVLTPLSSRAMSSGPPENSNFFPLFKINDTTADSLHTTLDKILAYNGTNWVDSPDISIPHPQDWSDDTYPVPIATPPNTLTHIASLSSRLLTLKQPDGVSLQDPSDQDGSIQAWALRGMTVEIKGKRSYVFQIEEPGTRNCLASNAIQGGQYLHEAPLLIRPCKPQAGVLGDITDPSQTAAPKTEEGSAPGTLGYALGDPEAPAHFQEYLKTLWLITIADPNLDPYTPDGPAHLNGFGDYLNGYYTCLSDHGTLGPCDYNAPTQSFTVTPVQ